MGSAKWKAVVFWYTRDDRKQIHPLTNRAARLPMSTVPSIDRYVVSSVWPFGSTDHAFAAAWRPWPGRLRCPSSARLGSGSRSGWAGARRGTSGSGRERIGYPTARSAAAGTHSSACVHFRRRIFPRSVALPTCAPWNYPPELR